MKFLLACFLGLTFNTLPGAEMGGKCVTLESDVVFRATDVIVGNHHQTDRYPVVQYDDAHQPTGLKWIAKNSRTISKSEKIALVGGKEVRRFVFWSEGGNPDGDGLVCVWLGLQEVAPEGGIGFRPFLVFGGHDQVRWWESFCAHDAKDGFTVVLEVTLKGHGVMWEQSTVQVKDDGPVPLRLESGGRGQEEPLVERYRTAQTSR